MKRLNITLHQQSSKTIRILRVGALILLVLLILEIWIMNRASIYGNKLGELQLIKANLTIENQLLENQITQNSSLKTIEEKAQSLGFTNIKSLDYIRSTSLASAHSSVKE